MTNAFWCTSASSLMSIMKFLHVFSLHTNVWLFTSIATSSGFYKPYKYSHHWHYVIIHQTCLSNILVTNCWEKHCWYLINILAYLGTWFAEYKVCKLHTVTFKKMETLNNDHTEWSVIWTSFIYVTNMRTSSITSCHGCYTIIALIIFVIIVVQFFKCRQTKINYWFSPYII